MRKKKLDVVFDENVNYRADDILTIVEDDIKKRNSDHKVSRSVVLRVAMHIGLNALMSEIKDAELNKGNLSALLKVKDIRASLGTEK